MGLRTYRYSPPTTRCSVGATGAGVPRPSTTNLANACTSTSPPATTSAPPSTLAGGHQLVARQPVSHSGPRPTSVPGASAMNTELPTAATDRRMGPGPGPRLRLVQARLCPELRAELLRRAERDQAARTGPRAEAMGQVYAVKKLSLERKIVSSSELCARACR